MRAGSPDLFMSMDGICCGGVDMAWKALVAEVETAQKSWTQI